MKVYAIIPAAGLGTRMSAGRPSTPSKQFTQLAGQPILIHTLRSFVACGQVDRIFVALRKNEIASFQKRLNEESFASRVELVAGGDNRQESVANALAKLKAEKDDVVLVHDGVRPFVTRQIIEDVIGAVVKHDSAIAGLPAVDTIKQVDRTSDGAIITSTIPRERVVMAQTPQGFRYHIIRKAFADALADNFTGTDEASLVERAGNTVAVVMGSPRNIKITTPGDMELAELFVKTQR
ncbi:MAG TPA: 2-C-methyl-D-erythritol 4-phosphate cytidylyltransferase [Terriglobales bacterium]|nr:2-C-methyl-D-erythritol 4-phosphate cytidylyltransferase [Terriglobales bacterium]